MSHLADSTFRNAAPHLPNSPGHGSRPAESVTTSHGILSPDLPICSMGRARLRFDTVSGMRSPDQGDAAHGGRQSGPGYK